MTAPARGVRQSAAYTVPLRSRDVPRRAGASAAASSGVMSGPGPSFTNEGVSGGAVAFPCASPPVVGRHSPATVSVLVRSVDEVCSSAEHADRARAAARVASNRTPLIHAAGRVGSSEKGEEVGAEFEGGYGPRRTFSLPGEGMRRTPTSLPMSARGPENLRLYLTLSGTRRAVRPGRMLRVSLERVIRSRIRLPGP